MKKIAWVVLLVIGLGATTTAFAQSKLNQVKKQSKPERLESKQVKKISTRKAVPNSGTPIVKPTAKK